MEVGGYTYDYGAVEEGCRTPERGGCQIPAASVCPPAPRKKAAAYRKQRREPKNGYFQPPDLEIFFAKAHRREAYGCL